jgi:hypothetical protein
LLLWYQIGFYPKSSFGDGYEKLLLVKREKVRAMGNEDIFADVGGENRVTSRYSQAVAKQPLCYPH